MLTLRAALTVLCACHGSTDAAAPIAVARVAPVEPVEPVEPVAKGVPHGSSIVGVAITEHGDAALTVDGNGSVRLWPSFDGRRPPVPVAAQAPIEVALTWAGRDLLAAMRDDAGVVTLERIKRDGGVRARVQLPRDYAQLIAVDGGVLVRTADHAIEWFDADGKLRGRVAGDPGERIVSIAARRGAAIALVERGQRSAVRSLTLGASLIRGSAVELPARATLVALSPDHRRLAALDATSRLIVYELGRELRTISNTPRKNDDPRVIGFTDNAHVAMLGGTLNWADAAALRAAPWLRVGGGAVTDGLVVTGDDAALAVTDLTGTHYLGYRVLVYDDLEPAGDHVALRLEMSRYAWLDDHLRLKRDVQIRDLIPSTRLPISGAGFGEHVLINDTLDGGKHVMTLVDLDHAGATRPLGTYMQRQAIDYDDATGMFGIVTYDEIARRKIDRATLTVEELPSIPIKGWIDGLRLLDPDRAHGLVAIVVHNDNVRTVTLIRADGTRRTDKLAGPLVRIGDDGTLYSLQGRDVVIRGQQTARLRLSVATPTIAATDADGGRFAALDDQQLVVHDRGGALLWRTPIWHGQQLLFSRDGKTLFVRAFGIVAFDAASGKRTAMECGWDFGLMTQAPVGSSLSDKLVCEE